MTNREKNAEEILDIACKGGRIAIKKGTGKLCDCNDILCRECEFGINDCAEKIEKWANAEYIEKPKISKMDREFLCYIAEVYKYVARDKNGILHAFE